jgi:hypothetical protein
MAIQALVVISDVCHKAFTQQCGKLHCRFAIPIHASRRHSKLRIRIIVQSLAKKYVTRPHQAILSLMARHVQ